MLTLEFTNRQSSLDVDMETWRGGLLQLLNAEGIETGEVSIAIVQDNEMHQLNRRYLQHDCPTDVLSFVLDRQDQELHGEIVVSADTAVSRCGEFGWPAAHELTLYVIHGALHLVGYSDKSPDERRVMCKKELHYLDRFGIETSENDPNGQNESDSVKKVGGA